MAQGRQKCDYQFHYTRPSAILLPSRVLYVYILNFVCENLISIALRAKRKTSKTNSRYYN